MKIFVLTLLFTFVMFLDDVRSMEYSTPYERAGESADAFEMKRYDLICRGSKYIGQYVDDVKYPFKITAPGEFVYSKGRPVSLHPKDLKPGDLLIRSNLKWGVYRQNWFHELPEAEKKGLSTEMMRLPECEPVPDDPRSRPSLVSDRHSTRRTRPSSPASYPPPAERPVRERSRSPPRAESSLRTRSRSHPRSEPPLCGKAWSTPDSDPSCIILGFKFEDLRFIRLVPNSNQNRTYELQRYTFPPDKPIYFRASNSALKPIPTEEQIVLSTASGDVYATVERISGHTVLRGIYTFYEEPLASPNGKRAKINMYSKAIEPLTKKEFAECPLGIGNPIVKNFRLFRA